MRRAERGGEDARGFALRAGVGFGPGDGMHRVIDCARSGSGFWIHAGENLSENKRAAIAGQRQTHFIDVGGAPDFAVVNAGEDGIREFGRR